MKSLKLSLLVVALGALAAAPVRADYTDAQGIEDACTAGALLDRNHISNEVVVAAGEAGCIYSVNGVEYLYTQHGSAKINPAELGQVALAKVPREEVFRIGGDRDEIKNGCLVFATCAFNSYKHDPHVVWAGLIAARVIAVNSCFTNMGPECFGGTNGHALTAFENDKREVFIQENGGAPRKSDRMTELAQRGDHSWHDSGTLAYCDHRIQGFTVFKDELGHPL